MNISPLTTQFQQAYNYHLKRTHRIDRITVHCYVGQVKTATACAGFAKDRSDKASANYTCCVDGIACHMEDNQWSNCSSSQANDCRAITIETACDAAYPYTVREDVYERLINLIADVCIRNKITKVVWIPDKAKALAYEPKDGEAIFTWHCWFANKACPGQWIKEHQEEIKNRVNAILEEEDMDVSKLSAEECYQILQKANEYAGTLEPTAKWAVQAVENAKTNGVSDGTRPKAFATRMEVMGMVNNALKE